MLVLIFLLAACTKEATACTLWSTTCNNLRLIR